MTDNEPLSGPANSLRNGIILGIFALVTTGLTTLTWLLTKDQIESEKELALLRAITELVPAKMYANDPYRDCTLLTDPVLLGTNKAHQAWRLRDAKGDAVAVLISSTTTDGYNGTIEIIVGHYVKNMLHNNNLAGVRVTNHNETPGLGDKIDVNKANWILQFASIDPVAMKTEDWQVKKDGGKFDAFTGATITPRAVLAAISKNIDYFNQYQQQIFSAESNCTVTGNGSVQAIAKEVTGE